MEMAALSEQEYVIYVKFAQRDLDLSAKAISETPVDVVWLTGLAEQYVPAYAFEGAIGFTTDSGNFTPDPVLALIDAVRSDDLD